MNDLDRILPFSGKKDGVTFIVCANLQPFAPGQSLRGYGNAISGSFSWKSKPCSILVNWGKVLRREACHPGMPESVLYRLSDGRIGMKRVHTTDELPQGVVWAIGGMGLLKNRDEKAEGFVGTYGDVPLRNAHTFLAVKGGVIFLCYIDDATADDIERWCTVHLRADYALLLDGGHVAAINCDVRSENIYQRQYYAVQAL